MAADVFMWRLLFAHMLDLTIRLFSTSLYRKYALTFRNPKNSGTGILPHPGLQR